MTAANLTLIMQAIGTRLATISGLRVTAYVSDQVNPPAAVVGVPPIPDYHRTFAHGKFMLDIPVTVLVSKVVDRIDQPSMATFADISGTNSIHAAIEADRTLGGTVDDCIVVNFAPLGQDEVGALGYYGGVFTLRVIASGV